MRKLLLALLIAFACILPLYIRSLMEAQEQFRLGSEALSANDIERALPHLRMAVAWNSPFNAYSLAAREKLSAIAFDENSAGEKRLVALRELLRGLRSSRNFLQPQNESDPFVTRIRAEIDKIAGTGITPALHLEKPSEPRFSYQILTQIMFWGWIAAVIWSIFKGFTPQGSIKKRELSRGIALSVLLYALWLFALAQA